MSLKDNQKLRIEHITYNNYKWVCECSIGNDAADDRIVTENDLAAFLNAPSLDRIPVTIAPGEDDERHFTATYEQWLESNDLYQVLADLLNEREGRTDRAPFKSKPMPEAAMFLNPEPLNNLLAKLNKNAA